MKDAGHGIWLTLIRLFKTNLFLLGIFFIAPAWATPPAHKNCAITVKSSPANALVSIDQDKQTGMAGNTFTLSPGLHTVEIKKPGYHSIYRGVELSPGQKLVITVELPKTNSKLETKKPRAPWLKFALLGTGLACLGTGAVILGIGDGERVVDSKAQHEYFDSNRTSTGFLIAGGALIVGAIIAHFVENRPLENAAPGVIFSANSGQAVLGYQKIF